MSFTEIDLASWPRREHFELFRGFENPHFSLTVEVDLTEWRRAIQASGRPFFASLVHRVTAVANQLEPFRMRMRGETVVLHDCIHPSFTVPWREDLFNFCVVDFEPDLDRFLARCVPAIEAAKAAERLILEGAGRDDMIYLSSLPWFRFTSMTHAVGARAGDSYPRIAWGRTFEREGRIWLPLNFQVHHGLIDGAHIARFLALFEAAWPTKI